MLYYDLIPLLLVRFSVSFLPCIRWRVGSQLGCLCHLLFFIPLLAVLSSTSSCFAFQGVTIALSIEILKESL